MNTTACRRAASGVLAPHPHRRSRGLPPSAAALRSADRLAVFLGEDAAFYTRMGAPCSRNANGAVRRLRPKAIDETSITD